MLILFAVVLCCALYAVGLVFKRSRSLTDFTQWSHGLNILKPFLSETSRLMEIADKRDGHKTTDEFLLLLY